MRYRRAKIAGGTYFFTVVTYRRMKLFSNPENVQLLREAFRRVRNQHLFHIEAFVLLPDHLHCIWTLPKGDHNFSTRWRLIKYYFSMKYRFPLPVDQNPSRIKRREKLIWQRRFWEHVIRDDEDFARHIDYIHYNPVKHGYVQAPKDWPYSSFHRYVKDGLCDLDFGAKDEITFDTSIGKE